MTSGFAALFLLVLLVLQVGSVAAVLVRLRRPPCAAPRPLETIALIVPIAALGDDEVEVALSAARLAGPGVEILYCAFDESDPAVTRLRAGLADRDTVGIRLLFGRERVTDNPKMDNVEKAVAATTAEILVFVDGNLEVTADLFDRLFAVWDAGTGLVTSPPLGTRPGNFWAEVECAFLDTFFARWQMVSDELGGGYANGKLFALRRSLFDRAGGVEALRTETAEDAAATRAVRAAGEKIRLTTRPFDHPLGVRPFAAVWNRNLRWARLRRAAYPVVFALEPCITGIVPIAAAAVAAPSLGVSSGLAAALVGLFWYGAEAVLGRFSGWPWRPRFVVAFVVRDVLAAAIWIAAWFGRSYVWRGSAVSVATDGGPPITPR